MSDARGLAIQALTLRRAPGIEGGFEVGGLSPGVNIVYGPNASGKTTLARAIAALLWPRTADALTTLSGVFRADGAEWRVALADGRATCQRDGQPADPPPFSQTDLRDRYLLALHELLAIQTDNRDFAAAILRESTGGYDVPRALQELGDTARRPNPRGETQRLAEARERVRQARAAQLALRAEQQRLSGLEGQIERARTAAREVDALKRALEEHDARERLDQAQAELRLFPEPVTRAAGDELQRLAEMRATRDELEQRTREAHERRAGARRQLDATRLGDAGLPSGLLGGAQQLAAALREHEGEIGRLERELAEACAVMDAEAARLPGTPTAERIAALPRVDAAALAAAADLARRAEDARGRLAALEQLAEWLGDLAPPNDAERERLREACGCLRRWLAQPAAGSDRSRRWLVCAALLVTLEALALAVLVHPAWLALALAGAALLARAVRAAPPDAGQAAVWRAQYERLGLEPPARWDADAVERSLAVLGARLAELDDNARRWERWSAVPTERGVRRVALDHLHAERAALAERVGFAPGVDEAMLQPLMAAVERWHAADARALAAGARLATARAQRDVAGQQFAGLLAPWGYAVHANAAEALGQASDLAVRHDAWQAATRAAADGDRLLRETLEPLLLANQRAHDALYDALALPPGAEQALRDALARVPDYRLARDAAERARIALDLARQATAGRPELRRHDRVTLAALLGEANATADGLDAARDAVSDIRARLAAAGRADTLERALADERRQLDALREARDRAWASAAGAALGDWLRAQSRDRDRPRVFHRARELFARVSQGRYQLDMDDGEPPRFRARDAVTGVGHALDELSSGTRLQLLLAVRLAFVELQEQGPRLPLLLDETLGNSDESRARALIEAVIQFARDGRQIFYFTAQHDEVAKWRALLADQPDVPHAVVDLAQARGFAEWERLPLDAPRAWTPPAVPAPSGLTHAAYGDLLRVPAMDVRAAHLGGAHLWHFVDDPCQLYELLRHDISTWGQLQTLLDHNGHGPLLDARALPAIETRARLYEAVATSWRTGRGRPLTRAALRDSGAVTDVFFSRVAELADELDGDAAALLAALEMGQLSRFHRRSIELLRAYCEEHGYLDPAPRLTLDEARAGVLGRFSDELRHGALTVGVVNAAFSALWR